MTLCCLVVLSGCAHSVRLPSGEKITFPSGSKIQRVDVKPGMIVVYGQSCFKEISETGTVVIVDEQPTYDYSHGFTALFISATNPSVAELIFRGDSFPIGVVTKEQWKTTTANK